MESGRVVFIDISGVFDVGGAFTRGYIQWVNARLEISVGVARHYGQPAAGAHSYQVEQMPTTLYPALQAIGIRVATPCYNGFPLAPKSTVRATGINCPPVQPHNVQPH